MRASLFRLLALWAALPPSGAAAQWPGEVEGRIVDALSGEGVEAASVGLTDAPHGVLTDASGRFRLRAVAPGEHELTVARTGYVTSLRAVRVENGRTARVVVELVPVALEAPGLTARVPAAEAGAYRVIPRAGAGARTVADLVEGLPGLTVTGRGPGAARTLSIRGSAPDAVLVLVDGVPLNDPVTGEADLSLVPADGVEDITVLPGARSARYGPRAEAGVVLVRTAGGPAGPRVRVAVGSLGARGGSLGWGGGSGGPGWTLSASAETLDGRFAFQRDPSVGGGRVTRVNADLSRWGVRGGLEGDLADGSARLRVGVERLERGLPGRSFAPTPEARQEERSLDLSAEWRGAAGDNPVEVEVWGARRRTRFHDPAPPAGFPWDELTRVGHAGVRGLVRHPSAQGLLHDLGVGWEVEHQAVEADALEGDAPRRRIEAGAFVTAEVGLPTDGLRLRGALRLDRDGSTGGLRPTHAVELSASPGPVALHLAHRSSFSPPGLADRFFRAGVGVEPNPDLRAERVPSELEGGASVRLGVGPWSVDAFLAAYAADVRGMIVWSPDHRFVWSPRNVDVRRRGIDTRMEVATTWGGGALRLSSAWSLARVTYAREDLAGVQLRYRPRHTASFGAAWESGVHSLGLEAHYVGSRLPVPSDVNRLPGFWTVDLGASTDVELGAWLIEPALTLDRALNARGSLIFAFPEPGRTLGLELVVRRTPGRP